MLKSLFPFLSVFFLMFSAQAQANPLNSCFHFANSYQCQGRLHGDFLSIFYNQSGPVSSLQFIASFSGVTKTSTISSLESRVLCSQGQLAIWASPNHGFKYQLDSQRNLLIGYYVRHPLGFTYRASEEICTRVLSPRETAASSRYDDLFAGWIAPEFNEVPTDDELFDQFINPDAYL